MELSIQRWHTPHSVSIPVTGYIVLNINLTYYALNHETKEEDSSRSCQICMNEQTQHYLEYERLMLLV
jgi:hypothetical protein